MFLFKLVPILFILIGLFNLFFPRYAWFLRMGWQFKNADPSQAALIFTRVGGIFAIILGIFSLYTFNNAFPTFE